jgi:hypothetical protein
LVEFYQRLSLATTWNGHVVRLDQLEPTLEVSVVESWDLDATNLTAFFSSTRVLSMSASLSAMYQWVTAPGAWYPTAIGTVEAADLAEPDPFRTAAIRVLDHHAHVAPTDLALQAVVLPRRNVQPYLLPLFGHGGSSVCAERYKTVDVTDPVAVVAFCRAAQQSQTAAYLLWRAGSLAIGEDALLREWRHRFLHAMNPRRLFAR